MIEDLRRHRVFLLSFLVGMITGLAFYRLAAIDRVLIGADVFFACYLLSVICFSRNAPAGHLRSRGDDGDEGMPLILALMVGAVTISIVAIFYTLRAQDAGFAARPALALLSVPLGWATIHTVMAFHYAGLWYAQNDDGKDAGGLDFPGSPSDPGLSDFLYFSFTLGMTSQTSDIAIRTTDLRRISTCHGALSFFYNVILLALALNLATG